jgi:hypothetical protein
MDWMWVAEETDVAEKMALVSATSEAEGLEPQSLAEAM